MHYLAKSYFKRAYTVALEASITFLLAIKHILITLL